MASLSAGTVTLLFTDIEGSTRLLQQLGSRYQDLLAEHRRLLRTAVQTWGGTEVGTQGDACFAAFRRSRDALAAAVAAQRAIATGSWPDGVAVRIRMGLHTGEPLITDAGYVGMDVHRAARICDAGHGGQILLSQTTRELVAEDQPEGVQLRDLGEHRLKDLARPLHLFQVVAPDLPADFPPLRSQDVHPHNLPAQLTSFIGREREMADVKRLIPGARLLTLTGPGGCGKTRLALQVAGDVLPEFGGGVWLVELAPQSDPGLVPQAVAAALGVREEPSRPPLATLQAYLRPKRLLLVLDNCEHMTSACAQLANALLQVCPELCILATSREPLAIPGERTYLVPPLSSPDPRDLPPLETLTRYEAVRLFVDRAVLSRPDFEMTNDNGAAIAQVCHELDGIPLAIELAAARVKALSVEQIARRLDDRFRLLTTGHRTALPHHQTLRAAMDWSYELLSEKERMLFRRLAIFAGGLTLDAAEAVAAGNGIDASEILDLLVRLVDKSLVVVHDANQEVRHGLLETVRQYARGRLKESGDAAETAARHRDYFLGLAERAEPNLRGPEQAAWFARLDMEHDNLRAALEWSTRETGAAGSGVRLAGALWEFWYVRGHWTEGRLWLEKLLSQSGPRAPGRARALIGAAALAWCQGDDAQGIALGEQSLILCRDLDDKQGIATALNHLAHVAFGRQEYARATPLGEQSLKLCRELGDKGLSTFPMNTLGRIALYRGDVDRAEALFKESLVIRTELGDQWGIASSLRLLGNVAASRGDSQQAKALYKKSLALSHDLGDKRGTAQCLESLAGVAMARGNSERAAQLLAAAEALRDAVGFPVSPVERVDYDHRVALVRDALGKSAFAKAWTEAQSIEADQVIEDALKL